MKKTKVMSIIAMVLFILALFSQVMYTVMYLIGALSSIDPAVSAVAKVLLTSSIPTIVSLVLMIVGVRLAATSKNTKIYPAAFFIIAGISLLGLFIDIISSGGKTSIDYVIRDLFLTAGFTMIAIDGILLNPNKALGIIGAALVIAIAMFFSFTNSFNLSSYLTGKSSYALSTGGQISILIRLMYVLMYYSMLQNIGIGALLYAIGRQPKDTQKPFTPHYPNGGRNGRNDDRFDYVPPQPPQQNDYQPPYNNGQ